MNFIYIQQIDWLETSNKQKLNLKNGCYCQSVEFTTTLIEVPARSEAMFDMINNLILGVLTAMAEEERKKERI